MRQLIEVAGYLCFFLSFLPYQYAFIQPLSSSRSKFLLNREITTKRFVVIEPEKLKQVQLALIEEYKTFFNPMIEEIYDPEVKFIDPFNKFQGIRKYRNNVDLLAGRTALGGFLFADASIIMHTLKQLGQQQIQTRWSLQLTGKFLPWKPRVRFTGISLYSLNYEGKIIAQEDYWDSVNLFYGTYQSMNFLEGVKDFVQQLLPKRIADLSAPEFPFELLRRARTYQVRRYPRHLALTTEYTGGRNEGFERLAGYVNGFNAAESKVPYFAPSIIRVPLDNSNLKTMIWPLKYFLPGEEITNEFPEPANEETKIIEIPRTTYAIIQFDDSATEGNVREYTKQLLKILEQDGFRSLALEKLTLAQFNAVYSLNVRRNEIWIELNNHFWN